MNFDSLRFPLSLGSDNHSGIHPRVMQALELANRGHAHAYGMDELSDLTKKEFQRVFGDVEAQYVFTGTAANVLALAPLVKSFEAVIASDISHLNVDECGAPEHFLGSKLWTLPSENGKIKPDQALELLERRGDQHYSQPRAVSLTQPTEYGTCYSLDELAAWKTFCRQHQLYLHLDGARLANAAVHLNCSLRDLTDGADSVSFGGTKNGLMGAEVVLLFSPRARENFKFLRKQAMQLSSKTRFLAAQYFAYLNEDLWRQIAEHSTAHAKALARKLSEFPEIKVKYPVESNGLFVEVPSAWIKPIKENFFFYIWDSSTGLCRWMISWDWTDAMSLKLLKTIDEVRRCSQKK